MNELEYYTEVFKLIEESLQPRPKGICPDCGGNTIRRVWLCYFGQYYTYKNKDEIEDYGRYQCECGKCFNTEPERFHFGEPEGIKIV